MGEQADSNIGIDDDIMDPDAAGLHDFLQLGKVHVTDEDDRKDLDTVWELCEISFRDRDHSTHKHPSNGDEKHEELKLKFVETMNATLDRQQDRHTVTIPVTIPVTPATVQTRKNSNAMIRRERLQRQEGRGDLPVITKHGVPRSLLGLMPSAQRASYRSEKRKLIEQLKKMDKNVAGSSSSR